MQNGVAAAQAEPSIEITTKGRKAKDAAKKGAKSIGRWAADHIGAAFGSSKAAGNIDLRVAYGDMMDRWRRWAAVGGGLEPTPRNIEYFLTNTYGSNAVRFARNAFRSVGVTVGGADAAPGPQGAPQGAPQAAAPQAPPAQRAPAQRAPAQAAPAQQAPAQAAPAQQAPAAQAANVAPPGQGVTQASVNRHANMAYALLTEPGQTFRSSGGPDKLVKALKALRAHTDKSSDKDLTQKVATRFRDSLTRNKEAANRYRFVDGDKILGLSEGRMAARRLLGRPLNERRIVVARVNRLMETGGYTTTEAGRIAKDLRFRMRRGLSLREAWNALLKEAQTVDYDDPMDPSAFKQFMRSLAGSLVQVGIIKVNNFYRNGRDRRLEVGGIDGGGGGMMPMPMPMGGGYSGGGFSGGGYGGAAPAGGGYSGGGYAGGLGGAQSAAPAQGGQQRQQGGDDSGAGVNARGVNRALSALGLGSSQYPSQLAMIATKHDAGSFQEFVSEVQGMIPDNDPVMDALKKDPMKLAFVIAKAFRQ